MNSPKLIKTKIREGIWEGILTEAGPNPLVEVLHLEKTLPSVATPVPGRVGVFQLRIPIPAQTLNDGVQTFLIRDAATAETLAHFTIITGVAMEDDLRAEVDLLRAELDMLKRAFRRHCLETAG